MVMPRKNDAQHFLEGTKSRVQDTPGFQGGRPKLPKHLCPAARSEMKRCIKLLEERGTLTPGDQSLLAVYAEIYSRWVLAKEQVGADLMVTVQVTDNNGTLRSVTRLNPLLKVVDVCEAKLVTLAAKLGLTPVDRARSKQTSISDETKTDEQLEAERLQNWFNKPKELSWQPPQPIAAPPTLEDEDE
jgi:P27 family predicted phage terminase small subunit